MSRYRRPKKDNKYYLDPVVYDYCIHYARMVPSWKRELAGDPDDDRKEDLTRRIDCVTAAAEKAAPDGILRGYLMQSVTGDLSVVALQSRGMPCGKNVLASMRRRFYFELSRVI